MSKQEFNHKNTIKLHEAIGKRKINLVEINKLIEKGADINASIKLKNYGTHLPALFAAISRDDLDLVKFLLAKGADINGVILGNSSPLEWAYAVTYRSTGPIYQNTQKIFEEILKNPKFETINPGLLNLVIIKKDLNFLEFLFDTGKIDLTQKDEKGKNLLDKVNQYINKDTSELMEMRDYLIGKGAMASKNPTKPPLLEQILKMLNSKDSKTEENKTTKQDDNNLKEEKPFFDDEVMKAVFSGASNYCSSHQDEAKVAGDNDSSDSEY